MTENIFPENLRNGDTFELSNGEQFTVNGAVRVSDTNVNIEVVFDEDSIDIPIAESVKLLSSASDRFEPTEQDIKDANLSSDIPVELHSELARFYRFWNVTRNFRDINEAYAAEIDQALEQFDNADLIKVWKH